MDKILAEVGVAVERAIYAGIGSIPAVNVANVASGKEWAIIGLAAAGTAVTSLLNSLRVIGTQSNDSTNQTPSAPPLN